MDYCVYPVIKSSILSGKVTINLLAEVSEMSPEMIKQKLQGNEELYIDEAIKINKQLFPNIKFEELFQRESLNYIRNRPAASRKS